MVGVDGGDRVGGQSPHYACEKSEMDGDREDIKTVNYKLSSASGSPIRVSIEGLCL